MPPKRTNKRRTRNQSTSRPVQEDPLYEHVYHAEFRAAFTTLANSVVAQNERLAVVPANLVANTDNVVRIIRVCAKMAVMFVSGVASQAIESEIILSQVQTLRFLTALSQIQPPVADLAVVDECQLALKNFLYKVDEDAPPLTRGRGYDPGYGENSVGTATTLMGLATPNPDYSGLQCWHWTLDEKPKKNENSETWKWQKLVLNQKSFRVNIATPFFSGVRATRIVDEVDVIEFAQQMLGLKENKYEGDKSRGMKHVENIQKINLPNYPEIILFNILVKIPPRDIHKNVMPICKQWKEIVSGGYFIEQNFTELKLELVIQSGLGRHKKTKLIKIGIRT
ncbi:hypothetical protein FXO37_01263 [Capsicum annuum]|nr:hypothetical protein FXO37_01263 [Capsicum annuum]